MRWTTIFIILLTIGIIVYLVVTRQKTTPEAPFAFTESALTQCTSFPNNSIQTVKETSRVFINLPKDFYPENITSDFTMVEGTATAGYISNAGSPGHALEENDNCFSTYIEFNGTGKIDLKVDSTEVTAPTYLVHFVVTKT
jgi:hypothetical protein